MIYTMGKGAMDGTEQMSGKTRTNATAFTVFGHNSAKAKIECVRPPSVWATA
jgi:hypothetical protein